MIENLKVEVKEFNGVSSKGNRYTALDVVFVNEYGEDYTMRIFPKTQEIKILELLNK